MIRRGGGGNFTREWGMTWGHLESEKRIQVQRLTVTCFIDARNLDTARVLLPN
jgi:hypothetical protein